MEEEKQSEAIEETKSVEEDTAPTPYQNPNRNFFRGLRNAGI